MPVKDKVCTVCGMRPYKLPSGLDKFELFCRIEEEIRKSVFRGYTTFLTGMSMGVDIWASEIILKLKSEYPKVRLICYLPCETQADRWSGDWREEYFNTLSKADDVICLQPHYTDGCMQRRTEQ